VGSWILPPSDYPPCCLTASLLDDVGADVHAVVAQVNAQARLAARDERQRKHSIESPEVPREGYVAGIGFTGFTPAYPVHHQIALAREEPHSFRGDIAKHFLVGSKQLPLFPSTRVSLAP
jgi:hypothetical protein